MRFKSGVKMANKDNNNNNRPQVTQERAQTQLKPLIIKLKAEHNDKLYPTIYRNSAETTLHKPRHTINIHRHYLITPLISNCLSHPTYLTILISQHLSHNTYLIILISHHRFLNTHMNVTLQLRL